MDMIIESNQIKEWVKRAYDNAVKHGWHNENKSNAHWLMMVCTEVAEAVQADRKGRYMNNLDKEGLRTVLANDNGGKLFDKYYSDTIEGKVESELADICIRIFDFMGVRDIAANYEISVIDAEYSFFVRHTFTENALFVTNDILCGNAHSLFFSALPVHPSMLGAICQSVLLSVFNWAKALDIDLVQHINLKMRYNESREYLHENKLY